MKELKITNAEKGQILLKYLSKLLPSASINLLHKSIRKKNITLNDKKCSGKEVLKENDRIKIWFSDETLSLFSKAVEKRIIKNNMAFHFKEHIIYENEHIIIADKPAGILTQGDRSDEFSLNDALLNYCEREKHSTTKPSVCNRLDRNTSGLVLCGKTILGLQTLNQIIKDRSLQKFYRCIVLGETKKEETLQGFLLKDKIANKVTVYTEKKENSFPIETKYKRISSVKEKGTPCSVLEVELITGRPHQIRAHLSSIGHPILGDKKYGNETSIALSKSLKINYQLLQAYSVVFPSLQGELDCLSGKKFISSISLRNFPEIKS